MGKKILGLVLLTLVAWCIRVQFFGSGGITFSYDQARDAFLVRDLLGGDLKVQGPPTSTQDFFHGVLYYYVVAPGYWLGSGSPIVAAYWLAFLTSLGAPFIYLFFDLVLKNKTLALAGSLLFTFSYEQTQYSGYLSNSSLATLTVPLFFFGLWGWMEKKSWAPIVTALGLGLSVQANFFLLYHIPVLLIIVLSKKIILSKSNLFTFCTFFLLAISSMLVAEAKFGFPSRNGITHLLSRSDNLAVKVSWTRSLGIYLSQMGRLFGLNTLPTSHTVALVLGGILVVHLLFYRRPTWWPLVILGLLAPAPALLFGGVSSPYVIVGLSTLVFLLICRFLSFGPKPLILGIVVFVALANLTYIQKINPDGQYEFAIQKQVNIKNEIALIDYVYQEAAGKPFSLNSITAPLYINTTWSYLFNWYGLSRYGYLPSWHGHNQIDLLGDNLKRPEKSTTLYFLIIEPPPGLSPDLVNSRIAEEEGYSNFNHQATFGNIIVQNRTKK